MILVVQIPCLNEEKSIGEVLDDIPREIDGIDKVLIQVIDDGSTDDTVKICRDRNVDYILSNVANRGLAKSFKIGLDHALSLGADILVNTDGDHQYPSAYIDQLVLPIIHKEADIVVGDRQTNTIKHFSPLKRLLQRVGTIVTKMLSGEKGVADAVSGFRAYGREAMLQLNVTSEFSYILDTTVQSSNKRLKTISIPIHTNDPVRPSRLFSNMFEHIWRSGTQILRIFAFYKPVRLFFFIGSVFILSGVIPLIRFLYFYFISEGNSGKVQSLIIGGMLISIGVNMFALGVIGDLMSRNRMLIEDILRRMKSKTKAKGDTD